MRRAKNGVHIIDPKPYKKFFTSAVNWQNIVINLRSEIIKNTEYGYISKTYTEICLAR